MGAPCIGNENFCKFMNEFIHPMGGVRYWNNYDTIPYLPLIVGYQHAGISVNTMLRDDAKDLFFKYQEEFPIPAKLFDTIAAPHLVYHLGSLTYAFPMFYIY